MNWAMLIATIVPSLLIIFGLVFGFGKWSSHIEDRIGRVFEKLSGELGNLTKATEHLTSVNEKQTESFHSLSLRVENHETRITVVEREITELKHK